MNNKKRNSKIISMDKLPGNSKSVTAMDTVINKTKTLTIASDDEADEITAMTLNEFGAEECLAAQQRVEAALAAELPAGGKPRAAPKPATPRRRISSYQRDAAYLSMFPYGAFPERANENNSVLGTRLPANEPPSRREHKFHSFLRSNIRRRYQLPLTLLPNIAEEMEPPTNDEMDQLNESETDSIGIVIPKSYPSANRIQTLADQQSITKRTIAAIKQSAAGKKKSASAKPTTDPGYTTANKENFDDDLQVPTDFTVNAITQRMNAQNLGVNIPN